MPVDIGDNPILVGFLGSLFAGLGTAVGAAGVFGLRQLSSRSEDLLLASAAGVMLAASFFSLIEPGLAAGELRTGSTSQAAALVIAGIALGAILMALVHHFAPHEHFISGREGPASARLNRIWLFVIAIALHNFPEGMAVGVAFAGGDLTSGLPLAIGIGLHNIPEGLTVAVALRSVGYSMSTAFWVSVLTGLVQPVGGLLGATAVWAAQPLLPVILGFAAGAMLYIISHEIIPETHRSGHATRATFALLAGFAGMMFLDVALD
ncbi:MAG: ZIP family metal transporter [Gammaproteobacteria bacterium]|nr:MAG: ZIP family metal transporter [Gammaproteobacteria bacterium]